MMVVSHHSPLSSPDFHPAVTAVLCVQSAHHRADRGTTHLINRDSSFSQRTDDANLATTPERRRNEKRQVSRLIKHLLWSISWKCDQKTDDAQTWLD